MIYFLLVVFFFLAFCLIGLILLQEGKGGGMVGGASGAMDAVMGARNPLRRWTVYFSVALLLLILGINYYISRLSPAGVPEGLRPSPREEMSPQGKSDESTGKDEESHTAPPTAGAGGADAGKGSAEQPLSSDTSKEAAAPSIPSPAPQQQSPADEDKKP